jgi:DNA-binding XRE family transcriptional regulator
MVMQQLAPRRRLQQLRVDRGLSRYAAARAIGISEHTLKSMEEGRPARVSSVKHAADYYGVPVSQLAPDLLDPVA